MLKKEPLKNKVYEHCSSCKLLQVEVKDVKSAVEYLRFISLPENTDGRSFSDMIDESFPDFIKKENQK